MPTYEYECDACGHRFEEFQSITAKPLRVCPVCGKRSLRRLIGTGAGLLFKGSGFYATDYRSSEYRRRAKADSPGSSDGGGKSETKSGEKKNTSDKSTASGEASGDA